VTLLVRWGKGVEILTLKIASMAFRLINRLFSFSICIALILTSCSHSVERKKSEFIETKPLKAEMVSLHEIISPDFMTLKGNNLIISSSRSKPTMLFAYSTPSLEFKADFGTKGQGPEEIKLFPMFCESPASSDLHVWGYSPVTIKRISISENGKIEYKGDIILKSYETFNDMSIIGDSTFVFYLPDKLTVKKVDLIKNNESTITLSKDDHREGFFYSNRGNIVTSESMLVYSYLFKKQIDIYDLLTLKLKTTISDGKKYPKPIPIDFESLTFHYVRIYAGEKYFYALYNGIKKTTSVEPSRFLEVFDYEGNPIVKYSFDIPPFLFVVDEKNGKIYGFNENYEDYLLRYSL